MRISIADAGSADERTLDAEVCGSGEPLLLIEGMSAHQGMWTSALLDRLSSDFTVATYDHRGIGASSPAREPFSIADLAHDAIGVLDGLGWESAHIVGTSMGGMVAQEFALAAPGRTTSLVLGCTTAGGGDAFGPGAQRLVTAIASRDRELVSRTAFEVNLSASYRAGRGAFEHFAACSTARRVPAAVVALQSAACLEHDTGDRLSRIDAPSVVIHGGLDEMIPVDHGRALAARIDSATLVEWPQVGHLFWWEEPELTAEVVIEAARRG